MTCMWAVEGECGEKGCKGCQHGAAASALDAARAAVQRSDEAQRGGSERALLGETRALRDAVRGLIQHVETQDARIARMEALRVS